MKIGKVTVEINGVSHKLVRSKSVTPCDTCSVKEYCKGIHANPFAEMCSTLKGSNGKFIIQK